MNRPTVPARRLSLHAVLIAVVLALLTGCAAPVTPKHTGMPATAAKLCGLYTPEEVLGFLGVEGDARASWYNQDSGVRSCHYAVTDDFNSGYVRIELRPATRADFDVERRRLLETPPEKGETPYVEVPGVADGAVGSQCFPAMAALIAFHRDTQIEIFGDGTVARQGELVNKLISDTQVP